MLHKSAILSWSEEKHGIRLSIATNLIWTSKLQLSPYGRCQSLQSNVSCPAEHLHCWQRKFLVITRPRLKPLCRWGQGKVKQYHTSLWICRPCHPLWPQSCFCSILTVPWRSWASSIFLGTPQEWEEWEGSSLCFLTHSRQCPSSPQQSASKEHLLLLCPPEGKTFQGQVLVLWWDHSSCTLWVSWYLEEWQQGWGKTRKKSCLLCLTHYSKTEYCGNILISFHQHHTSWKDIVGHIIYSTTMIFPDSIRLALKQAVGGGDMWLWEF